MNKNSPVSNFLDVAHKNESPEIDLKTMSTDHAGQKIGGLLYIHFGS